MFLLKRGATTSVTPLSVMLKIDKSKNILHTPESSLLYFSVEQLDRVANLLINIFQSIVLPLDQFVFPGSHRLNQAMQIYIVRHLP